MMFCFPGSQEEEPGIKAVYCLTCAGGPVFSFGAFQDGWDMVVKF